MKKIILTGAALAVGAALAGAGIVYGGLYDVSATEQHLPPTYLIMDIAMRRSIGRRADDIAVPELDGAATIERGAALYRKHCSQCHGAPGVAPEAFALGLRPAPANLAVTGRKWNAAEVYWVVKHGIKMTGMPAWEFRLAEADLWSVVGFVMKLADLSPRDYQALQAGIEPREDDPAPPPRPASPERGKRAMLNYACVTCHHIPGIAGAEAPVGPPLDGMASRGYIAGILPNEGDNMVRWLRFPKEVAPLSAMPGLGVTEQDALDMAAYLATLE